MRKITWIVAGRASGACLGSAGVPRGDRGGGHRGVFGGQGHLSVLQTLSSLGDFKKLVDYENVEDS